MRQILGIVIACVLAAGSLPAQTRRLTLAEAEHTALSNNPQISSASLTASAANEATAEVRANERPTLFGSVTGVGADSGSRLAAGALNNPVVYNRLGTGLTVNQLITDFGRTKELVESAKLRAQSQDQRTELTRAQVLLSTDRAYFNILRAQSVLQVAQQTVNARQLISQQVTTLAHSNLRSTLDVSFADVNLADARLLLLGAENDLRGAQIELATAMGVPAQTAGITVVEEPVPDALPTNVEPLIQEAFQKRPELAALRLDETAAERFAQAEHALIYPTVGLTGTAGFVPAGEAVIPGRYGAVGVNVSIPIFNGGLFKARRNEAELRAKAAGQNVNDLMNRVAQDVRLAYLSADTAYQRLALTAQLLQQAQLALDLAQRRYDLGLSSIVELSQAQLNLTSAQIGSATAKYDYQTERAVLAYQTGTLR